MRSRTTRWPWLVLAALAGLPALALTVLGLMPELQVVSVLDQPRALPLLSSFIGYGLGAAVLATVCLVVVTLRSRRRWALAALTALAVASVAVQLVWAGRDVVADDRPATGPAFRIMSLNLYNGHADPAEVVAQAGDADVVVLLEITPAAAQALRDAGLSQRFPYQVGDGHAGVSGSAIFSRYPLHGATELRTSFQQWITAVDVPDVGPVTVIAVHPCNPLCGARTWEREGERIREAAVSHLDTPTVVAGDFNAVDLHLPMQRLRRAGYLSATDVAGAGPIFTYPANRSLPAVIGIDHVLVNPHLTATSVVAFRVAGSDHRGLLATLALAGR